MIQGPLRRSPRHCVFIDGLKLGRKVRFHKIIKSAISGLVLCIQDPQFYVSYRFGLNHRQIEDCKEVTR